MSFLGVIANNMALQSFYRKGSDAGRRGGARQFYVKEETRKWYNRGWDDGLAQRRVGVLENRGE